MALHIAAPTQRQPSPSVPCQRQWTMALPRPRRWGSRARLLRRGCASGQDRRRAGGGRGLSCTAMKRVIVTGGAGFIGSHTAVELAEAGYTR